MNAGRKQKNTVDYFPHFVKDSKTKAILKNKFGLSGYAIWFELLEVLCKSNNHLYDCSDDLNYEWLLSEIGAERDVFEEIIQLLTRINKIDADLWEHDRIIWCQNLVNNLEYVYQKRVNKLPQKPQLKEQKPTVNLISDAEIPISDAEIQQSKVKRSKGKESTDKLDSKKQNLTSPSPSANGKIPPRKVLLEIWNKHARQVPKALEPFAEERLNKAGTRLKKHMDCKCHEGIEDYLHDWEVCCIACNVIPFMRGEGQKGWKASVDWLLKSDLNMDKIFEGKYGQVPYAQIESIIGGSTRTSDAEAQ